ncbi:hypothetical protein [Desulfomarina profundi]|uniref:hypothetical protein n=1 Tax=Desulfomarina profundi TaxID=2772557 RepID=UPI001E50B3BE|nr:hypothetical protein [Desulfomarina profundi]
MEKARAKESPKIKRIVLPIPEKTDIAPPPPVAVPEDGDSMDIRTTIAPMMTAD